MNHRSDLETDGEPDFDNVNRSESECLVGWDDDNDPLKPSNWSNARKVKNIAPLVYCSFLTPLGSTMFAPAIEQVTKSFDSTNSLLSSFSVSVWILGYFVGPLFLAPLSEMHGRFPVYMVCNALFVVFNVATAVAPSLPALIVFRFLAGMFGGCPLVVGAGTLGDLIKPLNRGKVIALWSISVILGPIIGPIAGGYMGETVGWRWICWTLSIAAGFGAVVAFIFQEETYPLILLQRKAARLRKETGDSSLRAAAKPERNAAQIFARSIIRPLRLLFLSPIVSLLSLYQGVMYGYLYLLFTTFPTVFRNRYGFSAGSIGLVYIGLGVGSGISVPIVGFVMDHTAKSVIRKGRELNPEHRLIPLLPVCFCMPIGLFWYGWAAEAKTHWVVPILGTVFVGMGINTLIMCAMTYLIDAHPLYEASAAAAGAATRSLIGAVLPLAGTSMYEALGLGWGNSLLGFLALIMCPLPWFFYKYGGRIRTNPQFQLKL
ncbi:benomyl/methotrexate resistance protein [Aaosphaeria arxii CBS 175.79]|uniref:Benomyl/methotrexate resistance protein n=1 Tax=Aaosphaeria arxii CBS 175.79 TaxID=1450172 RepID=A0A6A5X684_9PLEO|nr:benomyl/methotrexate resistance protein [Aaosphaeria arxii CBS 175.79]KAF2008410.1 benomyl/methotrexate resistance protein [Aaosphaeria arxii CBS 175.79]